jgi:hypothetical protein
MKRVLSGKAVGAVVVAAGKAAVEAAAVVVAAVTAVVVGAGADATEIVTAIGSPFVYFSDKNARSECATTRPLDLFFGFLTAGNKPSKNIQAIAALRLSARKNGFASSTSTIPPL